MSYGDVSRDITPARSRDLRVSGAIRKKAVGGAAKAALPAAPLLLFLLLFLVVPLLTILHSSVSDEQIAATLPETTAALQSWDGTGVPAAAVYGTLAGELRAADEAGTLRRLGRRVQYELEGGLGILLNASRALPEEALPGDAQAIRELMVGADPAWGKPGVWRILQRYDTPYSSFYLRWALGLPTVLDADGAVSDGPGYDFPTIYLRTVLISLAVTVLTVLIGYPVAYVIATSAGRTGAILLFLILLPFWTSLLVRVMSLIVVLQTNGVVNQLLTGMGLLGDPLSFLYTRPATIFAMTQIQLSFTVLPMLSVMRTIPADQLRGARSLGAGPIRAHATIFLPQAVPGIAAGSLLTFVMCLGFYITPELVGSPSDQMVGSFIAQFTSEDLNWGLAAALSVVLCAGAAILTLPLARRVRRHA
ncbi:ABC transporter permease [Salipiger sp. P9]|uniref:ABC transporter permease n=1 Tax=Salipiger pentaromativorans TaxID=2943193 RepID=UPI002157F169|nr:ABC transporter permease [Salipiger pentaromativorans]MCR8548145.1 ABC transporter permease [Salipiger pentaromativorans]